jgi:vacuolar iron transporter family protein
MRALDMHLERHMLGRVGWLRAAVLGANDGIVSTASLVIGVAAASATHPAIMLAGLAALVAGAMSMAAGEYVSVSSQSDAEKSDLAKEARELAQNPQGELDELTHIYIAKGLSANLARQVAVELSRGDQLAVHARDELGITEITSARPLQAAITSAATFAVGAGLPLLVAFLAPPVTGRSDGRWLGVGQPCRVGRTRCMGRRSEPGARCSPRGCVGHCGNGRNLCHRRPVRHERRLIEDRKSGCSETSG